MVRNAFSLKRIFSVSFRYKEDEFREQVLEGGEESQIKALLLVHI